VVATQRVKATKIFVESQHMLHCQRDLRTRGGAQVWLAGNTDLKPGLLLPKPQIHSATA
jgi:hypothetical protein